MDTGGYSSSENQCHHVLYSHRMPSHKDKGPPKTHLIPESSAVMALANLANSGAVGEDEAGTNAEN